MQLVNYSPLDDDDEKLIKSEGVGKMVVEELYSVFNIEVKKCSRIDQPLICDAVDELEVTFVV